VSRQAANGELRRTQFWRFRIHWRKESLELVDTAAYLRDLLQRNQLLWRHLRSLELEQVLVEMLSDDQAALVVLRSDTLKAAQDCLHQKMHAAQHDPRHLGCAMGGLWGFLSRLAHGEAMRE
jgi:hypothetical protein